MRFKFLYALKENIHNRKLYGMLLEKLKRITFRLYLVGGLVVLILAIILFQNADKIKGTFSGAFSNSSNSDTITNTISNADYQYIKDIETFVDRLDEPWSQINDQHRIVWERRNLENYRSLLLEGIALCEQLLLELEDIKPQTPFGKLQDFSKQYTAYSKLSLKSYLDYTYSKNPSDLLLGDKYYYLKNETLRSYNLMFVEILEQNNFAYTKLANGAIQYSVGN